MGEVDKVRGIVSKYLVGSGIDIGFGGNPVNNTAICLDLADPYSDYGMPRHLSGSASDLYWFQDNVMDYVFSSHLLEDFSNTKEVLTEWVRVLKHNGIIALFLPDEQKYRAILAKTGGNYNTHHQIENMSLIYMKDIFSELNIKVIHEYEDDEYGFLIVGRK